MFNGRFEDRSAGAHIEYDCAYCTLMVRREDLQELHNGSMDSQRLDHWHTVSWDPGLYGLGPTRGIAVQLPGKNGIYHGYIHPVL